MERKFLTQIFADLTQIVILNANFRESNANSRE